MALLIVNSEVLDDAIVQKKVNKIKVLNKRMSEIKNFFTLYKTFAVFYLNMNQFFWINRF